MDLNASSLVVAAPVDLLEIGADFDLSAHSNPSGSFRVVTFFIGEKLYGIAAESVLEITLPLPVAKLPNSPAALSGISALRGEVLGIVNLRHLLGEPETSVLTSPKTIVLKAADDETCLAFAVDRIHEITMIDEVDLLSDRPVGSILFGTAKSASSVVHIIDSAGLSGLFLA